jgi:hypothetical protein
MVQGMNHKEDKMKSITIHGIDAPLAEMLKSKAVSEGLSMNKTIKKILEEALGVKPPRLDKNRQQFETFCGRWSRTDLDEFNRKTEALEAVDPGDWQ